MRYTDYKRNNARAIVYAVILAVIVCAGVLAVQDLSIPSEHISQKVEVTVEK